MQSGFRDSSLPGYRFRRALSIPAGSILNRSLLPAALLLAGLLLVSISSRAAPAGVNGIITTVAGTGEAGFSGDGGAATLATLNQPFQVHVDGAGNYVLIDWGNQIVRKVDDATGTISSTDIPLNRILAVDDAGYIYASIGPGEWVPRIVVKINPTTGESRRIAGGSDPKESASPKAWKISLGWPITVDRLGRLYGVGCIDGNANCYQVLRVDYENDVVDIVAGSGALGNSGDGGDARLATVEEISSMAVDSRGNLTFSQRYLIRRVSADTGIISTVGDTASFAQPNALFCLCSAQMAVDGNDDVYFSLTNYPTFYGSDASSGTSILKSAADGSGLSQAFYSEYGYSGDGGPLANAQLSNAMFWDGMGLSFDVDGNLFIADTDNNVIRKVTGFGHPRPAVDTTPPEITPHIEGTLGKQGWYRSDIKLTWQVTDAESLVATVNCTPQTVTTDTAGAVFSCVARSLGGTTEKTVVLKRDTVAPSALALPRTAISATGWSGTARIHYTGIDSLSGIDSCTADAIMTTEGANQSSPEGQCTDLAGNVSLAVKLDGLNIDQTPPAISATSSPPPNTAGWNNTPVTVALAATDALSGVAADGCDAPLVLSADGAGQYARGRCADIAGNAASIATGAFNIDRSPPTAYATLTPAANSYGWNSASTTVSFSGVDAFSGSGIRNCSGSIVFSGEGSGQPYSGGCDDVAGNTSAVVVGSVNIDKTLPTIKIISPVAGNSYPQGGTLVAQYSCADVISGIATCSSTVASGAAISTSTLGTYSLTVLATDLAGNPVASTATFSIVPPAPFTLSPGALAFGDRLVNSSTALAVTIRNNSTGALALTTPTLSGTNANQFTLARTCGTSLAAGASCTVTATFRPTSAGAKTAAFSIRVGTSTQTVPLTGNGVAVAFTVSPTSLTFPSQARNTTSANQPVTVTNSVALPITLSSITLGGTNANQFVMTRNCGTSLAANASCTVSIAFRPTSAGTKRATLTVTPSGTTAKTVALTGTGT